MQLDSFSTSADQNLWTTFEVNSPAAGAFLNAAHSLVGKASEENGHAHYQLLGPEFVLEDNFACCSGLIK